jgi:hypothetical protein
MLPKEVKIIPDRPLIVTELDPGAGYATSATPPLTDVGGMAITASGFSTDFSAIPITGTSLTATGTGVPKEAGDGLIGFATKAPFTANITVSTSAIPADTILGAVVADPYSALITDFVSTFTITDAQILANQFLQFWVYAKNGDPGTFRKSNALATTRYKITQISNTNAAGDQSIGYDNSKLLLLNNKLFFIAYAATFEKLFSYKPDTNVIDQVSNTFNLNADMPAAYNDTYLYNNRLYFQSATAVGVSKLFVYDDTTATMFQLSNINGAGINDAPTNFFGYANKLFFKALGGVNTKAFYYDIALNQIKQLPETLVGGEDHPEFKIIYKDKIYYTSENMLNMKKLFSFDGMTVKQVSNTSGIGNDDNPTSFTILNNILYFVANAPGVNNKKLFSFDGVTLRQISNMNGGSADLSDILSKPEPILYGYNGKLYFTGFDNTIPTPFTKLFQYNPATNTIKQISNINLGTNDNCESLHTFENRLLIEVNVAAGVNKVLVYNESTNQLTQLTNTAGNGTTDFQTNPGFKPVLFDGKMFFIANKTAVNSRVYAYDFKTNELAQISDINAGSDDPFSLFVYNNKLYFWATNPAGNTKLFSLERL